MIKYKTHHDILLIRAAIISVCILLIPAAFAQEANIHIQRTEIHAQETAGDVQEPEAVPTNLIDTPAKAPADEAPDTIAGASSVQRYQIAAVNYDIKGMTRKYPLSQAVPIDTDRVFDSEEEMLRYLTELEQQFKNIRAIQSIQIGTDYGAPNHEAVIPVTLTIAITDTWNFIVLPYPSFDSNSGFQLKLKMQDFNFVGTLQPLKADIVYRSTETNQQIFSSSINFGLPFKAGPFNLLWDNSFQIVYAYKEAPKIDIATGLTASVKLHKRVSLIFGLLPELAINDRTSSQMSLADASREGGYSGALPLEQTEEQKYPSGVGSLYPQDRYYFKTTVFARAPVLITEVKNFGSLVWTPFMSLAGNWAFDGIQAEELKKWTFNWGHSLSLSKVNWEANFRKGLSFSFGNIYTYQFYSKRKMNIGFAASLSGYYPFINRVGIYGRTQFFYHLFGGTSMQAGAALRGILNKRVKTDTAFTFNLDIPIRIATLDFEAITGVAWTRFFNCDIQLVPFLDIALVHDSKTGRYYHPADGWYAGGMEVIVYPEKMRSIYVRASVGFDLRELKNLSGLSGSASRDGSSITEVFIGIGLHY